MLSKIINIFGTPYPLQTNYQQADKASLNKAKEILKLKHYLKANYQLIKVFQTRKNS